MDDKPEVPQAPKVEKIDLAAAVRRARMENAERAEAIAELRAIEAGRLALLESALKPVVRQAPPGVDMFDLTLSQGEHPRLFLDMVAFVDMGRDRRTYRFFQDTLHGRVLIAESQQIDRVVAAVTNYVARRLVERERALAAGAEKREPAAWPMRPVESAGAEAKPASSPPEVASVDGAPPATASAPEAAARSRRSLARRLADALSFVVMTLGSITLILLMAIAGYLAWTIRLRDLWTHWIGAPPF
jgi:hypothetical protein